MVPMAPMNFISQRVGLKRWLWIFAGTGIATVAVLIAPVAFFIRLGIAFIHEMGHAITGWVVGYPSLPTIDFFYGGGVTAQWAHQWWLPAIVILLLGFVAYNHRQNRLVLAGTGALIALYAAVAFTPARDVAVLVSGHLAELLFAGYLLYRVMRGCRLGGSLERAFLAAFVLIEDTRLSYQLVTDAAVRRDYEGAGVIGFQMDFSRLASDYLHVDVRTVATTFFICCLLTPIISYLAFRYRRRLAPAARRLARR